MVAIMQDPYESFSTIQRMSAEKKQTVKKIVIELIENGGRYNDRAPYAHTLFTNCQIPFAVQGALFPDGHFGNRII